MKVSYYMKQLVCKGLDELSIHVSAVENQVVSQNEKDRWVFHTAKKRYVESVFYASPISMTQAFTGPLLPVLCPKDRCRASHRFTAFCLLQSGPKRCK